MKFSTMMTVLAVALCVAGCKYSKAGKGGAGEGGAGGVAVYACIFLGQNAFGMIDVDGGSMEMIIKTPEQAGGPLNQFGTIGVYFETGGGVLYEERLLRVECGSYYSDVDEDADA